MYEDIFGLPVGFAIAWRLSALALVLVTTVVVLGLQSSLEGAGEVLLWISLVGRSIGVMSNL